MRRWAFRSVQSVLARAELRLVRWPRTLKRDGDAPADRFFPVGTHRPWTIPPDLRRRREAWARVLVSVYEDGASWPGSIAPEAGMLLHTLVRNIRPRTIVETGTLLGVSTIWMASGLKMQGGGELHTYDLFEPTTNPRLLASPLFRDQRLGVEKRLAEAKVGAIVRVHQGESAARISEQVEALRAAGGVQLAYLDGDHSPRGVLADFHAVERVLPVGGYIVLHDTFPEVCDHPGPRWLIDNLREVTTNTYQVCEMYTAQTNYGLAVLRRVG